MRTKLDFWLAVCSRVKAKAALLFTVLVVYLPVSLGLFLVNCPSDDDDNGGPSGAAPAFVEETYDVTIGPHVGPGGLLGIYLAEDAEGDSITYAITGGNTDDTFAIDSATSAVTVAAGKALIAASRFALMLSATATGGSDSATVSVTVQSTVLTTIADYSGTECDDTSIPTWDDDIEALFTMGGGTNTTLITANMNTPNTADFSACTTCHVSGGIFEEYQLDTYTSVFGLIEGTGENKEYEILINPGQNPVTDSILYRMVTAQRQPGDEPQMPLDEQEAKDEDNLPADVTLIGGGCVEGDTEAVKEKPWAASEATPNDVKNGCISVDAANKIACWIWYGAPKS